MSDKTLVESLVAVTKAWMTHDADSFQVAVCARNALPELARLQAKCNNSLANNLCPDHRDKQAGKPCLACEIERITKRFQKANEAREQSESERDICSTLYDKEVLAHGETDDAREAAERERDALKEALREAKEIVGDFLAELDNAKLDYLNKPGFAVVFGRNSDLECRARSLLSPTGPEDK